MADTFEVLDCPTSPEVAHTQATTNLVFEAVRPRGVCHQFDHNIPQMGIAAGLCETSR